MEHLSDTIHVGSVSESACGHGIGELRCSHLYLVLPDHPEEIQQGVRERSLRGDVGPGARHALWTERKILQN